MPTFAEILAGTGPIELVAEFNYRNPSTDTLDKFYVSFGGTVPATDSTDDPPSETFPARLKDPGTLDYRLANDLQLSGIAQTSLGDIVLDNTPAGENIAGPYDLLSAFSFSNRTVTLYGGAAGAAFSTFEIVSRSTVRGEPSVSVSEVRFTLQSPNERLDIPMIARRYVGIPVGVEYLTSTASASAPYIAAYANLKSYTVMGRFKVAAAQAFNQLLVRKGATATNQNISILLGSTGGGSSGRLMFRVSLAGTSTIMITSALSYTDGELHTWVASIQDQTTAYLMVDGIVIGTYTPSDSVDLQNEAFEIGVGGATPIGTWCDVRLYPYLSPEEAMARSAVVVSDGAGTLGNWIGDDGSGNVITDSSVNANHATITGVEDTDFRYVPTDLGMRALAGQMMPIVHGMVFNAPVDLIDDVFEHYRYHDGAEVSQPPFELAINPIIKARGAPLINGTDYTIDEAAGVIAMTDEVAEPVTFDLLEEDGSLVDSSVYAELIEEFMLVRAGWDATEFDVSALRTILPFDAGWYTKADEPLGAVLEKLLTPVGASAYLIEDGTLRFDYLLSPLSPGPYGNEPVLDFRASEATFGDIGDVTGSHTLICWFKSLNFGLASRLAPLGFFYKSGVWSLQLNADGSITVGHSGLSNPSLTSLPNIVAPDTWYFIAVTFNNTTKSRFLYVTPQEIDTPVLVAGDTSTGSIIPSANQLFIGGSQSTVAYAQVWSRELNLTELAALKLVPPVGTETGFAVYIPLTDGPRSSTIREVVSNTYHNVPAAARWQPRATYDFAKIEAGVKISDVRPLTPAWLVNVAHRINHSPMAPADISDSVSQSDEMALRQPYLSIPAANEETRRDYLDAFTIPSTLIGRTENAPALLTPLRHAGDTSALARNLLSRFGPLHLTATATGMPREGIMFRVFDEIRLITTRFGFTTGRTFRILRKSANLMALKCSFELWSDALVDEELQLLTEAGEVLLTEAGEEILLG